MVNSHILPEAERKTANPAATNKVKKNEDMVGGREGP